MGILPCLSWSIASNPLAACLASEVEEIASTVLFNLDFSVTDPLAGSDSGALKPKLNPPPAGAVEAPVSTGGADKLNPPEAAGAGALNPKLNPVLLESLPLSPPVPAALKVKPLLPTSPDLFVNSPFASCFSSWPGRTVSHAAHFDASCLFRSIHASHFQDASSTVNMLPHPPPDDTLGSIFADG